MEKERLQRYRQKINIATEKVMDAPLRAATALEIDATLYRVQVAIEASMDLAAMLVKDKGREVGDDYSNLHALEKEKVLAAGLAKKLVALNGLRNAIVHKYNSFEEATVIKNVSFIQKNILAFLRIVENELKTFAHRSKKGTQRS